MKTMNKAIVLDNIGTKMGFSAEIHLKTRH